MPFTYRLPDGNVVTSDTPQPGLEAMGIMPEGGTISPNPVASDFGLDVSLVPNVPDVPTFSRESNPAGWALGAALALLQKAIGFFGKDTVIKAAGALGLLLPFRETIETGIEAIIPGLQGDEFPPGLGSIQGRPVKRWIAGGQKVYFAQFEQPTRRGSRLQNYVWQAKRQAWVPYRQRRNIVIGAKELALASALGHKRKLGKRRVLQNIAGHFGSHPRHMREGRK